MFSSLKVRDFRLYWFGMLVSLVGTWIQSVAQSWLVFQLTGSAFLLGVVGFLSSIPIFVFSLFGGLLADRLNKRKILLATQTSFMLLAFLLAALTQLKLVTPAQIMFIACLNGAVMAFDAPSRQAVVVELVGKEHLLNAIALNSVAFNSSRIIGPAVAGILVATIGMSGCFYLNGISFLAVILALAVIRTHNHVKANKKAGLILDLKEGFSFVKKHYLILVLVAMVGMVSLFGVGYIILMPVFAEQVLKAGVKGLGVLMSASGFGALIGALTLARLGDFRYKGKLLLASSLIYSVSLILFSLSQAFFFALIALFLIGAGGVTSIALINTLLQSGVPDEFRGRVMSIFMLTFAGFMPFGNLFAGSLAQVIGVSATIFLSGVICTIFFILINLIYPQIRSLKQQIGHSFQAETPL
ncbi:MAG: MFS transporter [Candidatus Omnitrophica bacterium]|nr:MFS transporter [Candidatus Omnitrophota bacterium]